MIYLIVSFFLSCVRSFVYYAFTFPFAVIFILRHMAKCVHGYFTRIHIRIRIHTHTDQDYSCVKHNACMATADTHTRIHTYNRIG